MNLFQRLFAKRTAGPPLPALNDPTLGQLHWDADSEGWVGTVTGPTGAVRLYLGSGTAHSYPSEQIIELLRQPYERFQELIEVALAYLSQNIDLGNWSIERNALVIDGLESYEHYLNQGTYTITFTTGTSKAIWKVHFEKAQPVGCGIDD